MQIDSIIITLDFYENTVDSFKSSSMKISCKEKLAAPFQLITDFGDIKNRILLHCMGVKFLHIVSGHEHQIMTKQFMTIDVYNAQKDGG